MIYEIPGVADNGGAAFTGGASTFQCVNTDAVTRQIRFVLRGNTGYTYANKTFNLTAQRNFTASTHDTNFFSEDALLVPATSVNPAIAYIFATSPNIFCTAVLVDAASNVPSGIALHMVRRNAAAGTQE